MFIFRSFFCKNGEDELYRGMEFFSVSYTDTQNKDTTDDPGDRFADTYGDITVDRYDPPGKNNLSDQLQETAQ